MRPGPALAAVLATVAVTGAGSADDALADSFALPPGQEQARWRVSLEGVGVGDTVAHQPNAPGGGFEPVETRPRYVEGDLALEWFPEVGWALRASIGHRALAFKRDRYDVTAWSLSATRDLPSPHRAARLALRVTLRGNHAAELYKNSWTEIGGNRLTEARLFDARDATLSLDLLARTRLGPRTTLAVLAGIGWTRTAHERLHAAGDDGEGCRYAIDAAGGTGELRLLEPCGRLLAFREVYPDERGLRERLDFAPGADLEQSARLARGGLSLGYRRGRTDLALAWRHTHHDRAALDERVRAAGGVVVDSSRLLSLDAAFGVTRRLRLHTSVQHRTTAYLDELPLLYSRFTSERFASDTLSFGIGVSLAF